MRSISGIVVSTLSEDTLDTDERLLLQSDGSGDRLGDWNTNDDIRQVRVINILNIRFKAYLKSTFHFTGVIVSALQQRQNLQLQ